MCTSARLVDTVGAVVGVCAGSRHAAAHHGGYSRCWQVVVTVYVTTIALIFGGFLSICVLQRWFGLEEREIVRRSRRLGACCAAARRVMRSIC